ncbi:hypothetical protein MTR67_017813 [Solanum verrucosum]|uniref:Tf2-1-like SH3-like domain-containing protein n=1 Tax=Solanum verrucosum TaxID=315347 RepID=A0AAF0TSI4_SOLVR|nr:hypothetical protein MTR67_017813 [Solanum verrucosum]
MNGVMCIGKKGKLSSQYIAPYRILRGIGKVAYKLVLPMEFVVAYPVFHVSLLKKCVADPSLIVSLETVGVKYSLSFEEVLVQILDRHVHKLRTKEVASLKVLGRNYFVEEALWEAKEDMKDRYQEFFVHQDDEARDDYG